VTKPPCDNTNCAMPLARRPAAHVPSPGSTRLVRAQPHAV
jgi:hypothetical protein